MSYTQPVFEVADIIRGYRSTLEEKGKLTGQQKKVFTNLAQCRTAALGYHKDKCDNTECDHIHISYNSCRDRHCPKCNGIKREKWVCMREEDLLPVKYFHVVFTVTDKVNPLFLSQPVKLYNLLFASAWETIKKFGLDHKHLGAQMGMIAVLHSWGQNLALHPHVHCIIAAGGITKNGKWRDTRSQGKYLFPVKALGKVFRGIFCDGLIALDRNGEIHLDHKFDPHKKYLHPYYEKRWVVYAKLPMHNPMQVVNYIGRYTHRIAISNHRIKEINNDRVHFSWFNYRTSKAGIMDLAAQEFLQRFSLHVLPSGFMKIRHYGILSSRNKSGALSLARQSLGAEPPVSRKGMAWEELFRILYGREPFTCPVCKKGKMVVIESVYPRSRGSPRVKIIPNYAFSLQ
jgi:hypothetical protein